MKRELSTSRHMPHTSLRIIVIVSDLLKMSYFYVYSIFVFYSVNEIYSIDYEPALRVCIGL